MRKKFTLLFSVLTAAAVLAGCGNKSTGEVTPTAAPTEAVPTSEPTAAPTVAPTPTSGPTPTLKPLTTPKPTTAPAVTVTPAPDISNISLKEIYKDDFMIGTIYNPWFESGIQKELMTAQCNVITPENLMKPEALQPKEGEFYYKDADRMLDFAAGNGLTVIGHTLAWHSQSGNFLGKTTDREKAIEQLRSHVQTIASYYDGKVYSWDVLNEAIADGAKLPADGDWTKCLRKTQWTSSIGPDYVEYLYRFADEAAPNTLLYYNDYNLNEYNKAEIAAAMIKDLRSKGIRIDGVGMQGHYNTGTTIKSVRKALELFTDIEGLRISVTELDVNIANANGVFTDFDSKKQAKLYAQLFSLYKEYSDRIERVTFWGLKDDTSWRSEGFPCLFDAQNRPKDAFFAVADPEGYLASLGELSDPVAKTAEAAYGTPVVDGDIDDAYKAAPAFDVKLPLFAWQGATGKAQVLWDEHHVYVCVKVADSVLNASSKNDYEQDSVEVFLDEENTKEGYFTDKAGQYRVSYKGKLTYGTVPTTAGVTAAAKEVNGGYVIELAIPISKEAKAGDTFGFDLQINDSNETGNRISVMKFNDPTDSSYSSTSEWGNLLLK